MKKLLSLIKATMSSDMSLFKVRSKKGSKNSPIVPLFIAACFMGYMALISNSMLKSLEGTGMEYVFLSLIVILTCFLTIMEGVYKSGNLLFNCKDDDLLLSLPISKKTVLFIRVFKFYTFELMYNSLYLLPAIVVYTFYVKVSLSYYLVSFLMLFLLPIIPIVISCIIGSVITGISSRFKFKNAFQIIITMALLLGVFYVSMNIDSFLEALAKNAKSINDFITMIYYPAGVYVNLVLKFDALELLKFIVVNLGLFIFSILMLSKLYFSINSRTKRVIKKEVKESNKELVIKANSKTKSLVKKELGKFFKTPVFITNAGFALVLLVIATVMFISNFDKTLELILATENINISKYENIK